MVKTSTALIIHNHKILLLLRDDIPTIPNPNTWQTIGGHVDGEESFDEAIRREIKEETNLTPKSINYVGKLITNEVTTAVYTVYLSNDEVKDLILGNEGQALNFFSLAEAKNLQLSFSIKVYFEKYYEQLERLLNGECVSPRDIGISA